MLVKFENGEKDVNIIDVTADNYLVPDKEKHLYHCKIEVRKFNAETGKRMSKPRIQKFGKKMYESLIQHNLPRQGYTIDVLYNPTEYLKQMEEQKKQSALRTKQAAEKAMQEKIDAAVEAALAKERAKRSKKSEQNEVNN